MKTIQLLFFLFTALYFTNFTFAQEENKEDYLILSRPFPTGIWKADFTWEVVSDHAAQFSTLLMRDTTQPIPEGSKPGVYFEFGEKELCITRYGYAVRVPYTKNLDNHAFQCTFEGENLSFRVFYTPDSMILVTEDNNLIALRKQEN